MSDPQPTEQDFARCLTGATLIARSLWSTLTRDQLVEYLDVDEEDPEQPTLWDALVVRLNTTLVANLGRGQKPWPEWMTRTPGDPDKAGQ